MGVFDFLRKSKPPAIALSDRQVNARVARRGVRGRYDAAQTNDNNSRHWAATDSLNADKANSFAVRKKLRERARYEIANNAYATGIIDTFALDVVGQLGPRLQLLTGDPELNQEAEWEWMRWCIATNYGRKLRTLQRARTGDGEGFGLFITNERVRHPVKLDMRPLECDRCHDTSLIRTDNNVDGVILDEHGNPILYRMLDNHPGGSVWGRRGAYTEYGAEFVLHWFGRKRPEQHRGVPEILAALPLFALMRRWTLATVTAAETAANIAGLLTTEVGADDEPADIEAFDAVEIERNTLVTMPGGMGLEQFKAEQPTSTHAEFKRELLCEIARTIAMPRNIAAGDSSDYNFASGKLDDGGYFRGVRIHQGDMGNEIVDPTFYRWLPEARLEFGWPIEDEPRHEWLWPGRPPIDPREAKAETERLGSGATTLPAIYAAGGKDWRAELEKGAEALGVSLKELQALIRQKLFKAPATGKIATADDVDNVTAMLEELSHATRG